MQTIEIRRYAYTKKGAERGKGSHLPLCQLPPGAQIVLPVLPCGG